MSDEPTPLAHALGGSGGGILSMAITYPLLSLITKLQVRKNKGALDVISRVLQKEGWKGFYQGITPGLIGNAYAQFVYYYWYSFLRSLIIGKNNNKESIFQSSIVGAFAGSLTVVLSNPIWVVTTRMQTQSETDKKNKKNILGVCREIIETDGLFGFWRGLIPSLILVSNPTIQYMIFEQLKNIFSKKLAAQGKELGGTHLFLFGAIAKIIATIFTYPYLTVKTRLQAKQDRGKYQYKSTTDALIKVCREEGVLELFKGLESKLMQTVLAAALLLLFQDKLAKIFQSGLNMLGK